MSSHRKLAAVVRSSSADPIHAGVGHKPDIGSVPSGGRCHRTARSQRDVQVRGPWRVSWGEGSLRTSTRCRVESVPPGWSLPPSALPRSWAAPVSSGSAFDPWRLGKA